MADARRRCAAHLDTVAVLVLIGSLGLLWAPRLQGPIDLRYDAGVYYLLGTSLAEGRGYRLLNEPGEIEAVQYPPALPALVAAAQLALGTSDSVAVGSFLRLGYLVLSLAYALALYALARLDLGPGLALLAASLAVLHHFTFFLSDLCFAELPFAVVTLLFAIVVRRWPDRSAPAFVLGAAAVLLRTQGLALLGAWVGDSLLRRRLPQAAGRAAMALVPLLLWGGYVAHVTRSPAYERGSYAYQRAPYQYYNVSYAENLKLSDPFRPEQGLLTPGLLARRVASNLARAPLRLGEAVSAPSGYWSWLARAAGAPLHLAQPSEHLTRALRALLGLLVVAGIVLLAWRGQRLVPLYLAASYLLIAVTPWPAQVSRYVSPLAPFLAIALATAVGWAWKRNGVAVRALAGGLVAAALAAQAWTLAIAFGEYLAPAQVVDRSGSRASARFFYHGPSWDAFEASLDWLRAHSEPDAVIATSCPQLAYLRAGRRAVMPPMEADPVRAQQLLDSVPARYLVLDGLEFIDVSARYAAPVVREQPQCWQLVHEEAGVRVYHRAGART